jgi:hypothetical protein
MSIKGGGDWPPVPPVYPCMALVASAAGALAFSLQGNQTGFVISISINLAISIYLLATSVVRTTYDSTDEVPKSPTDRPGPNG